MTKNKYGKVWDDLIKVVLKENWMCPNCLSSKMGRYNHVVMLLDKKGVEIKGFRRWNGSGDFYCTNCGEFYYNYEKIKLHKWYDYLNEGKINNANK